MSALLLDTSALLPHLLQPSLLSARARQALEDASSLAVSAASVWEVATKHRIGKLPEVGPLMGFGLPEALASQAIEILPITGADADWAGRHPSAHKDPFDRIIAAQAVLRGLPVVSSDRRFDTFGGTRVW